MMLDESEHRSLFVACVNEDVKELFIDALEARAATDSSFLLAAHLQGGGDAPTGGTTAPLARPGKAPKSAQRIENAMLAGLPLKASSIIGGPEGEFVTIVVDEFVGIFSAAMFAAASPEVQRHLSLHSEAFTDLKAYLYVLFRRIDDTDSQSITWKSVVDFVIEDQALNDETERGATQHHYSLSVAYRFNPLASSSSSAGTASPTDAQQIAKGQPRRAVDATWRARVEARRRIQLQVASAVADWAPELDGKVVSALDAQIRVPTSRNSLFLDEIDDDPALPIEPIVTMRYLPASQRILAICKPRQCCLLSASDFQVCGFLPQQTSMPVAGDEMVLAQGSLLVTSQRDQTVRVWSVNQAPRSTQVDFCLEYENQCPTQQSAVAWLRDSPQVLFTGGVRGDVRQWRFDHDILADYRRGDAMAFAKITTREWNPGVWHSEAVTCIKFVDGAPIAATCSSDATVSFFDLEKDVKSRSFRHRKGLFSLSFSPNQPHCMITCGFEFTPYVWDTNSRSNRPQLLEDQRDPHVSAIVGVEALAGAPIVVSCDASSKMKTWDLRMMRCLGTLSLDKGFGSGAGGSAGEPAGSSGGGRGGGNRGQITSSAMKSGGGSYATSMIHAENTGAILISGRSLYVVESSEKTDPMVAFTSPCVGVVFDERNAEILTAHETCVVIWNAATGHISKVHPFAPRAQLRQTASIKGEETIRTIALAPKGQFYFVGSSYGRLTKHKLRSGETVLDTGRIHDVEVERLVTGITQQGDDFVLSIGIDGSCRATSDSQNVPPSFFFHHDKPAVAVFSPERRMLFVGTENGMLLTVDVTTVLSKGPVTKVAAAHDGSEIAALCVVEALNVAAVASRTGSVSFWGLKGCPITGKELLRIKTVATTRQSDIPCTQLAAVDTPAHSVVAGGDSIGRLTLWSVDRKIAAPQSRHRRDAVARIAVVRVFEDDGIASLVAATAVQVLIAVSFGNHVVVLNLRGEQMGRLCHGRGLPNVEWPGGVEPPYDLPGIEEVLGADRRRSARTIKLIHAFLRKLRQRVLDRRAAALGLGGSSVAGSMIFTRTFATFDDPGGGDLAAASASAVFTPVTAASNSRRAFLGSGGSAQSPSMMRSQSANEAPTDPLGRDVDHGGAPDAVADPASSGGGSHHHHRGDPLEQLQRPGSVANSPPSVSRLAHVATEVQLQVRAAGSSVTPTSSVLAPPTRTALNAPAFALQPSDKVRASTSAPAAGNSSRVEDDEDDEGNAEGGQPLDGAHNNSAASAAAGRTWAQYSPRKGRVPLAPAPPPTAPPSASEAAGVSSSWRRRPASPNAATKLSVGRGDDVSSFAVLSGTDKAVRALLTPTAPRVDVKSGRMQPRLGEGSAAVHEQSASLFKLLRSSRDHIDRTGQRADTKHSLSRIRNGEQVGGTLSTADRMDLVVGQLVVLHDTPAGAGTSPAAALECSTRDAERVMHRVYTTEEAAKRRRRALLHSEPQLRYAMGSESQREHRRVVDELRAMDEKEKMHAQQAQQAREALLRGPPLPPEPVCRRLHERPKSVQLL